MKFVEIISGRDHRHSFEEIKNFISGPAAEIETAPLSRSAADSGTSAALPAYKPPAWRAAETPAARLERIRLRLRNLRDPDRRALCVDMLDGKPFAKPGRRDEELNRIAAILTFLAPEAEPNEILEILRPSLAAMRTEANDPANPAPTDEDALKKIEKKLEQARIAHAREQAVNDRIRATLIKEARGAPPPEAANPENPGEDDAQPAGEYTAKELDAFAASQDCSPDEFKKRWIIQRETSFYVFGRGTYLTPLLTQELEVSLRRDLSPVPLEGHPASIEWFTHNKDGSARRKNAKEIVNDYATVARSAVADLTLRNSYYDPQTQTFHEAACPLRDISPRYDERVDEWLHVFGGAEAEKLLDWIATVTKLERQSCALYLSGPKGTGKGMLANGLSRLWIADGSPTDIRHILDNFNADLLRCPLVFADEHIPQTWRGQRTSAELRQLVGSDSRTLARKFMPNAPLVGAIRLVMAANNERLLALDEDLSSDDLEAVGQRFLHIDTPQASADFLKKLGGRNATDGWVRDDLIARHAAWLAQNRKVIPGDRFLVEGHQTRLHQNLPTQSKTNGLVVEWLVRYLDAPQQKRQAIEQTGLVLVGNGHFLVNVQVIADTWAQFITSDGPPSTGRIGRALKTMSSGTRRMQDSRFHEINLNVMFGWADENQIGQPARMKGLVDKTLTEKDYAPIRRANMAVV